MQDKVQLYGELLYDVFAKASDASWNMLLDKRGMIGGVGIFVSRELSSLIRRGKAREL